jgi:O-antigen ligase
MRVAFICYAIGAILNVLFIFGNSPELVRSYGGYYGYFTGKNYLGEFAAALFLLALHESLGKGARRVAGICMAAVALTLLLLSESKTALGLALLMPLLAAVTLMAARTLRLSPAILLLMIPIGYMVGSAITGVDTNRLSYMIYGDPTFTGRTIIWEFAKSEIAQRPFFGWGYQSFWLAGPGSPSILRAPGWIKEMPNAHSGYYDTLLETGYTGLGLLLCFIFTTLHAIGQVGKTDRVRAWGLLSIALYIICYNFLESLWFRGFEFLWIMFLLIAAETARLPRPIGANASGKAVATWGRPNPARLRRHTSIVGSHVNRRVRTPPR